MPFDGECIKEILWFVPTDVVASYPVVSLPSSKTRDCCIDFSFKVLADTASNDPYKNDQSGFLWSFFDIVLTASLKLFKNGVLITTLADDTYGTNYPYGFFVNDEGIKFVGYHINWKLVLQMNGPGCYQVKCTATSALGTTITLSSDEYQLYQYTPYRANGTVKIEYYNSGVLGISEKDDAVTDYGTLVWYNSIRLPGYFGFPSSTYTDDYIQYENGQLNYTQDEQLVEYTLGLKPVGAKVHNLMRTDVLQADHIYITDYNANNADAYIEKAVKKNGPYSPNWKPLQSKLASVEVKLKQEFQNLRKFSS